MPRPKRSVLNALVNRNVILAGIIAVAIGAGVTASGTMLESADWCAKWVAELVKELGTATFGIGVLALFWELAARRDFLSETLATVDLSDDIEEQGLKQVTFEYLQGVPWPDLFQATRSFDLFVSYARTWTKANAVHLAAMADRGVIMRVLLPDPADSRVVGELAVWYRTTPAEVAERIRGAIRHFTELAGRPKAAVEVRLTPSCPLFTTYLFDRVGVFTTHSHRPAPAPVPTFVVERGKPLFEFFQTEFLYLWNSALPTKAPTSTPSTEGPQ